MAHHIMLAKLNHTNSRHITQNLGRILQAAGLAARQIDLGNITGNHHLAAKAKTCQKHLHLLWRGILSLIQNDKSIIQGTTTHIGQGSYLYGALGNIFLEGF